VAIDFLAVLHLKFVSKRPQSGKEWFSSQISKVVIKLINYKTLQM
jgi:hypothetical protein